MKTFWSPQNTHCNPYTQPDSQAGCDTSFERLSDMSKYKNCSELFATCQRKQV